MGYFNYFIKCIIRNIAYKLCKPKVFLTVLLSVAILFSLKHFGYCAEWTDGEIEAVLDGLATITQNQSVVISQLSSMGLDVDTIQKDLDNVKISLNSINNNTSNINLNLIDLVSKVNSINTSLTQLAQQQNIYYENVTNKLDELMKSLNGDSYQNKGVLLNAYKYYFTTPDLGGKPQNTNVSISSGSNVGAVTFNYTFKAGYTYNFNFIVTGSAPSGGTPIYYTFDNVSVGSNVFLYYLGSYTATNTNFSIKFDNDTNLTLFMRWPIHTNTVGNWTITAEKNGSIGNLNNSINQGNQLQQEQNQLQQEQNDFLKQETTDSDVSVDSFDSVDSNDITSDGLTGVFTNIYNSISSWSSNDINLPIPYTNKNIVIPANYTHNMLSSFGGSWIISFISSIYYFIVARFIIYSITSIINSIKSGSILETDSKNNITTDML